MSSDQLSVRPTEPQEGDGLLSFDLKRVVNRAACAPPVQEDDGGPIAICCPADMVSMGSSVFPEKGSKNLHGAVPANGFAASFKGLNQLLKQAGSGKVDADTSADHVESRHRVERRIESAMRRLQFTSGDPTCNLGRFVIQAFKVAS